MKEITALLPFKRNSERIPNKNFKLFHGKPLYKWTLKTLLSIKFIKKIIINTDAVDFIDKELIKKEKKIYVRNRPYDICGDDVSMNKIIEDDINYNGSGLYLMTHTTNPLISINTIINGINLFFKENKENNIDSLFTVNKFQSRFYFSNLTAINHSKENLLPTQKLNPIFEENSNFYIFSSNSFYENKNRIGKNPLMFETPFFESIDIDTFDDWEKAEFFFRIINES